MRKILKSHIIAVLLVTLFFGIAGAEFIVIVEPEETPGVVFDTSGTGTVQPPAEPPQEPPVTEPPAEELPAVDTTDLTNDETPVTELYTVKVVFDIGANVPKNTKIVKGLLWLNHARNEDEKYYRKVRMWVKQPFKMKNKGGPRNPKPDPGQFFMKTWSRDYNLKSGGYEWDLTPEIAGSLENGTGVYVLELKYYNKLLLTKPVIVITCEGENPPAGACVPATVEMFPKTLNLKSMNPNLIAHVSFENTSYKLKSAQITAIENMNIKPIPAIKINECMDEQEGTFFKVWFDRYLLNRITGAGEGIEITISGTLTAGENFSSKTPVKVIDPGVKEMVSGNGAEITCHPRAWLQIPRGAIKNLTEITIATDEQLQEALEGDAAIQDNELRISAMLEQSLVSAGEGCNFGPEGTQFEQAVAIKLFYDEKNSNNLDEASLCIYYWNAELQTWERLASTVNTADHSVSASTTHFSLYQLLSSGEPQNVSNRPPVPMEPALSENLSLEEIYCYPNPARGGINPTFHVKATGAKNVVICVYNVAGKLISTIDCEGSVPGVYERGWDVSGTASGIYIYTVTVSKEGFAPITAKDKIGIIK